jgi:hypothetical protein
VSVLVFYALASVALLPAPEVEVPHEPETIASVEITAVSASDALDALAVSLELSDPTDPIKN